MPPDRKIQWAARIQIWGFVVVMIVGANAGSLNDTWSNWNFLYLGCQAILVVGAYPALRRFETQSARWLDKLGRN